MIRALLVTTVIATLALSACGDSDSGDQANSEAAATTTNDAGNLEAWCLGLSSPMPMPDVDEPISAEDMQAFSEAEQRRNEAMLEVAPAEIAEANQTTVDAGRELNAYFAANNWDPDTPRLMGATGEYELAAREVTQFADDNC